MLCGGSYDFVLQPAGAQDLLHVDGAGQKNYKEQSYRSYRNIFFLLFAKMRVACKEKESEKTAEVGGCASLVALFNSFS